MNNLTQHPKWSPSKKLYFKKFNSQITVGPTEYEGVSLRQYERSEYRLSQSYVFNDQLRQYEVFTTVHTSNQDILNHLCDCYPVVALSTPVNSDHLGIIEDVHIDSTLRKTLYYRKFRYRVLIWQNHRMDVNVDDFKQAGASIKSVFQDEAKFLGDRVGYMTYYSSPLPTVFTNNEPGIMMLKLMLGNKFRIQVTKVYVLSDLI